MGLFTVPFLFRAASPAEFTAAWRRHAPGIAVEFAIVGAAFWFLRLPVVAAFGERLKARSASRK